MTTELRSAAGPGAAEATPGATFYEILARRAAELPEHEAFTFLGHDGQESGRLGFGALDRRAREIAGALQALGLAGERALLSYPPGLECIEALFGCIYAGVIAVPSPPPDPGREYAGPRIRTIAADARPRAILSPGAIQGTLRELLATDPPAEPPTFVATDTTSFGAAGDWSEPATASGDVAVLQYTSGSTGVPRGVMVTHANLIDNCRFIEGAFEFDTGSGGLMWLPPYHDLGLVGGIFQPIYWAGHTTLMSPVSFLVRPLSWLEAISRRGATRSGGPDFAYDLAVRRVPAAEREGLDLSGWELAYTGAELVKPETMDAFCAAYEPHGFRRQAFYPCYGLAEATLMVTGGVKEAAPNVQRADRRALEQGRFATAEPGAGSRAVTACGRPGPGARVAIVDPESREEAAAGTIGEIWVQGPSVAAGYFAREAESAATFGARLADGPGPFLRTGDLGFVHEDELYVTGRTSEILVIDGRAAYPTDVERTAERGSEALRPSAAAAFTVGEGDATRLVLAAEARPRDEGYDDVFEPVAAAVERAHELRLDSIRLLAPRTIPRTSSGKIRRAHCAELFRRDELDAIAAWERVGG